MGVGEERGKMREEKKEGGGRRRRRREKEEKEKEKREKGRDNKELNEEHSFFSFALASRLASETDVERNR